jgi:hypothetical protein
MTNATIAAQSGVATEVPDFLTSFDVPGHEPFTDVPRTAKFSEDGSGAGLSGYLLPDPVQA